MAFMKGFTGIILNYYFIELLYRLHNLLRIINNFPEDIQFILLY